jgi:hypothetical protein
MALLVQVAPDFGAMYVTDSTHFPGFRVISLSGEG